MPLIGPLLSAAPPGDRSLAFSNWFDGFNLSWELDLWGRIRRNIESNNASLDASVEDYDAALVTLLADVATNYVQYRIAQQRIKIARDNVRIQEGVLALAEEKFRVGTTTRLDVEQARTVLEQTRSTIPSLQIALGRPTTRSARCSACRHATWSRSSAPGPSWAATRCRTRRPGSPRAFRRTCFAGAPTSAAPSDRWRPSALRSEWPRPPCTPPSPSTASSVGMPQDFSKFFETKSFIGAVFPSFSWNILNYGRIKNNVRLQEAKTQELIATYQNTVLTAGREVQTPLRGFLRSREQAEDLDRSVKAATAATQLGVQQYRTGIIDFNRVFNLETTQVQQQDQLAVAAGNIALNLVNVYRALGGGWELRYQKEDLRHTGRSNARCLADRCACQYSAVAAGGFHARVSFQPHCPRRPRSLVRVPQDEHGQISRRSDMRSQLAKWTVVLTLLSCGQVTRWRAWRRR